jgi:hypothetical protein
MPFLETLAYSIFGAVRDRHTVGNPHTKGTAMLDVVQHLPET